MLASTVVSDVHCEPRVVAQQSPLAVQGLSLIYDTAPVLSDVSFTLRGGCMTAVVGPNGAGKSCLLRACLGLAPHCTGHVTFFGHSLAKIRRRVAFMPQREAVDWSFPIRVLDVVCMGMYGHIGWLRWVGGQHRRQGRAALEQVGLADYANRQIGELSGGQQKRVFLARALVQNADLVILDEPFAGVDAVSEAIIARELQAARDQGTTILLVHHDLLGVRRFCDECLLLNTTLRAQGPVQDIICAQTVADAYDGVVPLALLPNSTVA